MELEGKVALVTGGSSGIGRAVAELLGREGASVVIGDVRQGETTRAIERAGGRALFVRSDVREEREVRVLVEEGVRAFGGLDLLCNIAGIELIRPMVETAEAEWDDVIDTNLKSVYLVTRAALPRMIERGGGAIVNMASQLGIVGMENWSAYCASKGGVITLTKALALECARHHIRVNCVCPGAVDTPMVEREVSVERDRAEARRRMALSHPIGRIGRPEEVAQAFLFLASDRSSFITGEALVVDGGYTVW